jgi:hypothetical protein
MIRNIFFAFFILLQCSCFSQDYIFLKNKSVQKGQVIEVTTEKVRYKKTELPNGPTYEVLKNDVIKITYSNGYTDFIDTSGSNKLRKSIDTTTFSIIYVLFNSGQDETQDFPLYFNGQYICNLKNHMRLRYIMHSTGPLIIERKGRNAYRMGPRIELYVEPGVNYGINIKEPYPQAINPNKRFSIETFTNKPYLQFFLDHEFYGFKPFKDMDIEFKENVKHPVSDYQK